MDVFVILMTVATIAGIGATLVELRGAPPAPQPVRDLPPGEVLGDGGIRWRLL